MSVSQPSSLPRGRRAPNREPEPTRLRLVVPQIARRRVPTPFLCVMLLLVGLVAILIANIYISHTTFKVEQLTAQNQKLTDERDRLGEDIAYRSSPQNIERAAKDQGLVHANKVDYLFLSTGKIVKDPESGSGDSQGVSIPGPRADTREDVSPNLRSNQKVPAVGSTTGGLTAPHVQAPKK